MEAVRPRRPDTGVRPPGNVVSPALGRTDVDVDLNEPWIWAVAAAVVVVVVALVVWAAARRRRARERTARLRDRFGVEYDRTVERVGSRADAEDQLERRLERQQRFQLRPVGPEERRRFLARWEDLQVSFVDGPASALRGAEVLVDDLALARGYPDASGDQRLDDLAAEHSDEVTAYRDARRERDDAEGQRRAMLASRSLFEALLGPEPRDAAARGLEQPEAPFERVLHDREGDGRVAPPPSEPGRPDEPAPPRTEVHRVPPPPPNAPR
ncbi:hypothetical protein FTX61_06625 [Nitriliruptoraceae bacterium ZYF776]|nr:hypothetical protein [Profundirhabdus halotolerans]